MSCFDKKGDPNTIVTYVETNDVDLISGEIYPNTQIPAGKLPNRAKYVLKENDILIPNARDCVRGVAMATKEHDGYVATNRFFVVRNNEKVLLKYLYYLLKQPEIHYLIKRQATGEINPSIPPEKLNLIKVPVPDSKKEQQKIIKRIETAEKKIERLKKEIIKSEKSISIGIRGCIPDSQEPSERAKKLGSEFIKFI